MLVPRFGESTAINNILGDRGQARRKKKKTFTVEASETVAPTSNTSYFKSSYLSLKSLSNF